MEFYLHNKDDQKSSTLVELATTFKIDDINYIVYYNKQVEKSMIDIYIGIISYGDQSLVINKIDSDKQGKFLSVIKDIMASKSPETEYGDYDNIIGTATIILESVQKIQIPTTSLEILNKYHKKEETSTEEIKLDETEMEKEKEISSNDNENPLESKEMDDMNNDTQENKDDSVNSNDEKDTENQDLANIENNDNEIKNDDNIENNSLKTDSTEENKDDIAKVDESKKEDTNTTAEDNNASQVNYIHSNYDLDSLDDLLDGRKEEVKKKINKDKKKVISTPVLILLILTVIITAVLYFIP